MPFVLKKIDFLIFYRRQMALVVLPSFICPNSPCKIRSKKIDECRNSYVMLFCLGMLVKLTFFCLCFYAFCDGLFVFHSNLHGKKHQQKFKSKPHKNTIRNFPCFAPLNGANGEKIEIFFNPKNKCELYRI